MANDCQNDRTSIIRHKIPWSKSNWYGLAEWLSWKNDTILPSIRILSCRHELAYQAMDETQLPFMDATCEQKLDELLLKLPRELREIIYANILGPIEGHHDYGFDGSCSAQIVFARRIGQAESDIEKNRVSSEQSSIHHPRNPIFRYMSPDQHLWFESCARRIAQMNGPFLKEFMDHYFSNTILDLKAATRYRDVHSIGVIPHSAHHWLKINTTYHPFIRNLSLDVCEHQLHAVCCYPTYHWIDCDPYECCEFQADSFPPFCRTISRKLELDTLILWIVLDRTEADDFFAGRIPPEVWTERIEVIRTLKVRRSFEVHTSVGEDIGMDVSLDEQDERRERKELLAEFEKLDEILYPLLLPDTLRDINVANDPMEEYVGISELFEDEEKNVTDPGLDFFA